MRPATENNRSILVTGAAGFIGSHLVRYLLNKGKRISILVKPSTDLWRLKGIIKEVWCVFADLTDFDNLKKQIKEVSPSGVFHLAASNIASGVISSNEDVIRINILGTVNLIQALEDVEYEFFINTGTFLEYGTKDGAVNESDPCSPPELYSITKLAASLYCQSIARSAGKPIVTLRVFTPYGPMLQIGRLVYELINRALKNEDIQLTNPNVTRDFIYVEDLVGLYLEAAERAAVYRGNIFNAGTGRAVSLGYLSDYVLKLLNSKSTIKWGAFRNVSYDADIWQADMTKTYSRFIWRPTYSFEEGIKRTVEWLKNNVNSNEKR